MLPSGCPILNTTASQHLATQQLRLRSPAKINWDLRILGKRSDGFHELESLVSPVTLYDDLEFQPLDRHAMPKGIHLECDHPEVPSNEDNLIFRAVRLLEQETGRSFHLSIRLTKRVPLGGGLGGGSSNAATTLTALQRLYDLNYLDSKWAAWAAALGSDVPLFLAGESVLMRGRGERLERVRLPWDGWIVLILPAFSISTAEVYRTWSETGEPPPDHDLDLSPVTRASDWMARLTNMLETPALRVCPELGPMMAETQHLAARPVRMSGSGSSLFTAFDEKEEAQNFETLCRSRLPVDTRCVRVYSASSPDARADAIGQVESTEAPR